MTPMKYELPNEWCPENCPKQKLDLVEGVYHADGAVEMASHVLFCENEPVCEMWVERPELRPETPNGVREAVEFADERIDSLNNGMSSSERLHCDDMVYITSLLRGVGKNKPKAAASRLCNYTSVSPQYCDCGYLFTPGQIKSTGCFIRDLDADLRTVNVACPGCGKVNTFTLDSQE